MANVDAPRGLVPRRHKNGAPYSGASNRYYVAAGESNNIFIGDPVSLTGTGDAAGVPAVERSGVGDAIVGVVVGYENLTSDGLSQTYRPASTAGYLLVADDPDLEYTIQSAGTFAVASIGLNADIVIGTGSTSLGTSGVELDQSTAATTNTLALRILGIEVREDNEVGLNADLRVKINLHPHNQILGA